MAKTKEHASLLRPGQTILFDGDSLTNRRRPGSMDTWPFLDMMNWRDTYADEIERLLFCLRPDLRLSFRNVGIGGQSCRELAARFDDHVAPYKPDWIIMTLGGNDSAREIPMAEFREKMGAYVRRAREEWGGRVVFVGGFKACPDAPEGSEERYARRAPYYRAERDIARRHGGLYVDAGTPLQRKARALYKQSTAHTIYSDGGHFNSVGSLIIAAEVLHALGVSMAG
jgi:lysophospholipase L1-like esterase